MRPSFIAVALAGALACAAFASCGSSLPGPPAAPQPTEAFTDVPYPPPPAKVEYVPRAPDGEARWIDGQWRWLGDRWKWEHGGWYRVPAGAGFAKWETRRDKDGNLRFAAAAWRDPHGHELPTPPLLARATNGPGTTHDGGEPPDERESEAGLADAPSMFEGGLYDAAALEAAILDEAGFDGGLALTAGDATLGDH